ncbi:MAG: PKD domain-containing protein, partial [Candidatus Cloacimonetes bacterium]|nr:PKD domain-containing protein [Candidatus Cloacimonadota bacterium]
MKKILILLLILICTTAVYPQLIEVCLSGDKQFTDLQEALDFATNNSTIRVYPGTYIGPFTMNRNINLTLESLYATEADTTHIHTTKLTAPYPEYIITFSPTNPSPLTITLNGFSISNDLGDTYQGVPNVYCIGLRIRNIHANIKNNIFTNHFGGLGNAVNLTGPISFPRTVYLENNQIYNNVSWISGAGLSIGEGINAVFSQENRNSIFNNIAAMGKDISLSRITQDLTIYLDKGSRIISKPDGNYVWHNRSIYAHDVTIEILQETLPPFINHDIFVASWGDDSNSGLNPSEPLRSLYFASTIIASDSLNPKAIRLASGTYTPIDGKMPRFFLPDWTKLIGAGIDETIIDVYDSLIIYSSPNAEIEIRDLSIIKNQNSFFDYTVVYGEARKAVISNIKLINHPVRYVFSQSCFTELASTHGNNNRSLYLNNIIILNSSGHPIWTERINNINIKNVLINNIKGNGSGIGLTVDFNPRLILNNVSYTSGFNDYSSIIFHSRHNSNRVLNFEGSAVFNNVLIANNNAYDVTGFLNNGTVNIYRFFGETVLNNWTIANNRGPGNVAALVLGGTDSTINNMILYNPELTNELHIASIDHTNQVTINNSLIYGNRISVQGDQPAPILNNVVFDSPAFLGHVDSSLTPDMWEYYYLSSSSPAIDAGIDVSEMMDLDIDLAGNPRVYGSAIDMGVFEFQGVKADFTAEPLAGHAPLTVQFTDLSTGAAYAWEWEFVKNGKWSMENERNPLIVFDEEGVYTVTLTINDGADSITKEDFITVFPREINVDFMAEPREGYAPLEVQFTCLSEVVMENGGWRMENGEWKMENGEWKMEVAEIDDIRIIHTWEWDFDGDGIIDSTEQNPVFVYTEEGTYSVTLTITVWSIFDSNPSHPISEIVSGRLLQGENSSGKPRNDDGGSLTMTTGGANEGSKYTITKPDFIVVGPVSENDETILPFAGHNLQNYPNPVNMSINPNVLISFDLPIVSNTSHQSTTHKPIGDWHYGSGEIDPIIEIYN